MTTQIISSSDAITLLVASNGNAALAAARAKTELGMENVTEPLLLAAIASDPTAPGRLYQSMQTLIVLQGFDALRMTKKVYMEKLPMMSPDSVGKTYERMLSTMAGLTKVPHTAQDEKSMADRFQDLLSALPQEVRDAFEVAASDDAGQAEPLMKALMDSSTQESEQPGEAHPPRETALLHPEQAIGK